MIELNVVGWSALLAPPALVGGVGALALGRPVAVGALGGAGAAMVAVVAWDRLRCWNSVVSVSSDLDLDELRRVVERLRAEGIDVTGDAADHGPVVSSASDREQRRLTTRQRLGLPTDEHLGRQSGASPGVPPGASPGWSCASATTRRVVLARLPWRDHVVVPAPDLAMSEG